MYNIMEEYISIEKKYINIYMKMFLEDKWNREISNRLLEKYIFIRYLNNDVEEQHRFFYRRIYGELMSEAENLKKDFPSLIDKIEETLKMYQYIFFLDGVRPINDLKEFIEKIYNRRLKVYEKEADEEFKKNLQKTIKENFDEREKLLKRFNTDDFELSISKYALIKDIYEVKLKYKFKISYIYSQQVIEEVFNEKLINEDKLMIEYLMLCTKCIREINEGNFETKYFVDFPISVIEKEKKKKQILRILENQAIQEKINFKVPYKDFILNKDNIYDMMRQGYRFVIALDETFKISDERMKLLDVFNYILIDKKIPNYEDIFKYKGKKNNFIINET